MSSASDLLRWLVAERAHYCCEYCLCSQRVTVGPYHLEHILSKIRGGSDLADNLAYSCAHCNLHKATRVAMRNPVTKQMVPLFNPRSQVWSRHFMWSEDRLEIRGLTQTGRATVLALVMNDALMKAARSVWLEFGIHPIQVSFL